MTWSCCSSGVSRARLNHGVTLMEMLVTLVVVSLTTVLLSQALAQSARVERMLSARSIATQGEALRLDWLRQTIESTVALDRSQPDSMRGDAQRLEGRSTQLPGWPFSTTGPFAAELRYDTPARTGELILWLGLGPPASAQQRIVLLEWQGSPGRIQYLGSEGAWADSWPPVSMPPEAPRLPRAVMIRTGSQRQPLIVIAPLSGGQALVTRSQIEKL
jgi:prepilin-type N-terminal cleavage/methylation domain-containing protein